MKHTRRDVLRLGGALGAGAAMPFPVLGQTSEMVVLTAQPAKLQLAPAGYSETEIWGYDGRMPGPTIRVQQGDRVRRQLVNNLPQATSVHWHGIRIDNAMDGVAGLTQEAVPSGGKFDYDFEAPDAGTFWYHAHDRSVEQVARGLYGALVVEEPTAPDVDRDEVLVLDDWLLDTETAQIATDFEAPMHRSHAGRRGNFVVANGQYGLTLNVKRNDRLRLRLINAANARIFEIALSGLEGWALAYDGMPLSESEQIGVDQLVSN